MRKPCAQESQTYFWDAFVRPEMMQQVFPNTYACTEILAIEMEFFLLYFIFIAAFVSLLSGAQKYNEPKKETQW